MLTTVINYIFFGSMALFLLLSFSSIGIALYAYKKENEALATKWMEVFFFAFVPCTVFMLSGIIKLVLFIISLF